MRPDLAVERWPVAKLLPSARNARTHSDDQVAQIAASITSFGFNNPCLVDSQGEIIAGHGRVLAARKLGLPDVPVIQLGHLTDEQVRAFRLADNKLAMNSGWDFDLLAGELAALRDVSFDLGLTGFDDSELAAIFAKASPALTDPDEVPETPAVPETQSGDLWQLGDHRVLCGDATNAEDVARLLDGAKPPLMVTDPPYGVDYDPAWRAEAGVNSNKGKLGKVENDTRDDWFDAWALFPGDVAYVWHSALHASNVEASLLAAKFVTRSQIVWAKDRFALSRGDYHWQHEPCFYSVREGAKGRWQGDRSQATLWSIAAREDAGHGHGTQKPVECMRRPVLNNSKAGDAVYDPFLGSGTTLIAAQMEGRRCYGIEINPAYVDVAVKRWENFTGRTATRAA